ncbi:MAG: proline dehydrogenase family protein [Acidobacteriota bacterium]
MSVFGRLLVTALPLVPKFVVGRVASRYVAGETLDDALRTVKALNDIGAMATLDILGEEVQAREKATWAVDEYVRAFETLRDRRLDSNMSIKLTLLGLKIDENFCLDNVRRIAATAKACGNFVRIDMEDRSTTDATLRIYKTVHAEHGNMGIVLQAYMRRTPRDIADLPADKPNVRICKGIYIEPRDTAWKGHDTVRQAYLGALEKLLAAGIYVGIATHDEFLACGATALLDRYQTPRDRYEFQMLLGVDPELRRILIAQGHRLRVYVPYGADWYPYSIRRLRENPEVATHVMRAMFGR